MGKLDASSRIGELVDITAEGVSLRAYIPRDLPFDPPLQLDPQMQRLLQEAYLALGRLDGAASILPDREQVYYMYLRKEAVLSSQIEGTQSSLEDFLRFEQADVKSPQYNARREILNYVTAVEYGLELLAAEGLTLQLIQDLHSRLLGGGRGGRAPRGRLRTEQNYIGGRQRLMFIPPPPALVRSKMENLMAYIQRKDAPANILVKAAVAHVQFETIHPFMDGNGRLGRMLIALLICQARVLRWPLLFLSLYLKQHRFEYYESLTDVREHGDWESWVKFFLTGVIETADTAASNAVAVSELLDEHRRLLRDEGGSYLRLFEHLVHLPITSVKSLASRSGLSKPTVRQALEDFCLLGICSETTGAGRNRRYRYNEYLDLLNAGTELA